MESKRNNSTQKLVLTAMMACLTLVLTYLIKVPVPATEGYIHLGDSMVFFGMMLLGWKYGAVAAALGSSLADLLGGFTIYAPITFAAKFIVVVIAGLFIESGMKANSRKSFIAKALIGTLLSCIFMLAAYYVAESIMYGNWAAPLIEIPLNVIQFVVGFVLAVLLATQIERISSKRLLTYHLPPKEEK